MYENRKSRKYIQSENLSKESFFECEVTKLLRVEKQNEKKTTFLLVRSIKFTQF